MTQLSRTINASSFLERALIPCAVVIANFVQACCWHLDRAPAPGETRRAHGFHTEPGGKGLNVAVALQRLGVQVLPVLAHGQDAAGEQLCALLASEQLNTSHVHALPMASGWGAGFIERDGSNRIAVFPGANDHLSALHVQQALVQRRYANFVYGQFEVAIGATEAAMVLGHQAGHVTVLNPSPWQAISAPMRHAVHTYIVNSTEASALLGADIAALAQAPDWPAWQAALRESVARFWATHDGARALVITLGRWGCMGWLRETPTVLRHAPGLPVPEIDTIGCGDAFAAGFCWARYTQGMTFENALAVGNRCGARLAAHSGVLSALPTLAQLRAEGMPC